MKNRILILAVLVTFLCTSVALAEEPTPQVIGSDTITFRGYIEAGLYFSVSSLTDESFNLLTTEELLPTGDGVDIGQWTLRADNPPAAETSYTIRYEYTPISNTNENIDDEIAFVVLEREEDSNVRSVKANGAQTVIGVSAGQDLSTFTRIFSARLTDEGAIAALRAAASPDYIAYITVNLESGQ